MRATRFLLAMAALAGAAPASAELDLKRADISHLPNGLTVIMLEDHSFPLVSVQMLYKSGSAAETTGKTGLAHFLEHLAFRGSANFPKARATELIYDHGGEWHGYTALDQTAYFSTMPKDQLGLLLRIEADRMARVVIDPASIEAEKAAVITELHGYENDPASVLQEAVTRTAIQAHPYGSPMAGYVSDVEGLTAEDARTYYASHYAPGNAVLTIVGDFVPSQAKAMVAESFAGVAATPVAKSNPTRELPQTGQRRTSLTGPVERQYFQLAFPSPAASNSDFAAFLVLQQLLSGGSGLNLWQGDWAATQAIEGSALAGTTDDIATWLPPTREPFLFTISGSIEAKADQEALERSIAARLATIRDQPITGPRLAAAKDAVTRAIAEDVQTTEDAAHQLAFFEGVGALELLLAMPRSIASVTPADIQRVARTYLAPEKLTVGWMLPGKAGASAGLGNPRAAADRSGVAPTTGKAGLPQLRQLQGGLTAIVQASPLFDSATVEILLSAPVDGGEQPDELPGLGAITRSGPPDKLAALVSEANAAARQGPPSAQVPSEDPAARLEQLIAEQLGPTSKRAPSPLAVIVSGNVEPQAAFAILERQLGNVAPAKLGYASSAASSGGPKAVREQIARPLSQGALGYVVEGPLPGTREALAWRMLLYVLTHDYSGRLGWSAISNKGLVYHIESALRTDGKRSWATLSTGVDPGKADAMEAELRRQLARLVGEPPTAAEVEAARNHQLGRDLTASQSNEELAAKLARSFVETGGLRTHDQLRALLQAITPADLAKAAQVFASGTIIRVDVEARAQ